VAIILGLFLIGVFKFNIGISQRFMPKRKALLGAFLMGLFFGIVASPCATPVLAVILTFAATQKKIAYSGGLLLCYALGHWILVLGAGISAGFAQTVLASRGIANFSNYSKKFGGVLLIGAGLYLIISLF
jgi:cytochrome c biogenesis protein CcdA